MKEEDEQPLAHSSSISIHEERLRTMAADSAVVVWYTGANGAMTDTNPGVEAYTGLKQEQYLGWRWIGSIHPDDAQELFNAVQRDLAAKGPAYAAYRLRRRDGEYREMEARVTPVVRDGAIVEWVGVSVDVTERNVEERALRAATRRLLFLERLCSTLQACTSASALMQATAEAMARQLDAPAFSYGRFDGSVGTIRILHGWHANSEPAASGTFPFALFGPVAAKALQRGIAIAIGDAHADRFGQASLPFALKARSMICVPLIKGGTLDALLMVSAEKTRTWTGSEVLLVRQAAARLHSRLAALPGCSSRILPGDRLQDGLHAVAEEMMRRIGGLKEALPDSAPDALNRHITMLESLVRKIQDLAGARCDAPPASGHA